MIRYLLLAMVCWGGLLLGRKSAKASGVEDPPTLSSPSPVPRLPTLTDCFAALKQRHDEGLTVDRLAQFQPNPFLVGSRWRIRRHKESSGDSSDFVGRLARAVVDEAEFEIAQGYSPVFHCAPSLQGTGSGTVQWRIAVVDNAGCSVDETGTKSFQTRIAGHALADSMHIEIEPDPEGQFSTYTIHCPPGAESLGMEGGPREFNHDDSISDRFTLKYPNYSNEEVRQGEPLWSPPGIPGRFSTAVSLTPECDFNLEGSTSPRVETQLLMSDTKLDQSVSTLDLSQITRLPFGWKRHLGLTKVVAEPWVGQEDRSYSEGRFGSRVCFSVGVVRISVSLAPHITIASDYAQDSCNYKAVLAHEEQHVEDARKAALEHLEKSADAVREAQLPSIDLPMAVSSALGGEQQVNRVLAIILQPMIHDLLEEIRNRTRARDTPSEYSAVLSQCPESSW